MRTFSAKDRSFQPGKRRRTAHNSIGKKSNGVKSGNLGGQAIGASLPIHSPGKVDPPPRLKKPKMTILST
jgi:hypothetical protein